MWNFRQKWTSGYLIVYLTGTHWPRIKRSKNATRDTNIRCSYAGFRLTCRLPHCRFDDDICSTAQAPLAAEGWPSGKQRQANRSITLPLCPPRQIADSWILCNSGAMPLGDKAKAALPLRAATLKQQAMITRRSGKRQVSLKPALLLILQSFWKLEKKKKKSTNGKKYK